MKRERSNFQSCKIVETYWRINGNITPGIISGTEKAFIEDTLELKSRNDFEIQDLRDFAVIYLTSICKDHTDILHDKMWDCMSAVTATIDGFVILKKNQAIKIKILSETKLQDAVQIEGLLNDKYQWSAIVCFESIEDGYRLMFDGVKYDRIFKFSYGHSKGDGAFYKHTWINSPKSVAAKTNVKSILDYLQSLYSGESLPTENFNNNYKKED